jgi:hypothetical protein
LFFITFLILYCKFGYSGIAVAQAKQKYAAAVGKEVKQNDGDKEGNGLRISSTTMP